MAFVDEFADMMPHTVLVASASATMTVEGQKSWGSDVEYAGFVEQKARVVRDSTGRQVMSSTTVYLATSADVKTDARVTLPSGFTPQQPKIIAVDRPSDEGGDIHVVLRLE